VIIVELANIQDEKHKSQEAIIVELVIFKMRRAKAKR